MNHVVKNSDLTRKFWAIHTWDVILLFSNILETQVKLLVLFTFGDFVSAYALVSQKLGHTIRRAGISMGKFQKCHVNIQGILWN